VTDGSNKQILTIGDKIRDVNYLLSSGAGGKFDHSSKSSLILLLGILVQLKEGGRYYLEDPTGAIPLDLAGTISFENVVYRKLFIYSHTQLTIICMCFNSLIIIR